MSMYDNNEYNEDEIYDAPVDPMEEAEHFAEDYSSMGSPKKPVHRKFRRPAARVLAGALVFGLVSGTTFYGVNTCLSKVSTGKNTETIATANDTTSAESVGSSTDNSLLSSTDSNTISSTGTTDSGSVADVAATAMPSLVTISCTTVEQMESLYDMYGNSGSMGDLFNQFGFGSSGYGSSQSSFGYGYSQDGSMQDGSDSQGSYGYGYDDQENSGDSEDNSNTYEVESAGTGVIIGQNSEEILIATNNHVISGADTVSIGFVDETAVSATVKGVDAADDLAVVSVKIADIPQETLDQIAVAEIGDSDSLQLGEQVVAIGNALGYGQSVTSGYISAFNRDLTLSDETTGETINSTGLIQTDASINAGNSGGGLFNMNGQLIAINEAKSSSSEGEASVDNMGFAIPMAKAQPILEKLMNGESVSESTDSETASTSSAYLGIHCTDVSEEASSMYGIPVGICVVSVEEDSPAYEYGIQTGDVITEFNGQAVSSYEELVSAMSQCQPGDVVSMTINRSTDGVYNAQQVTVTLGDKSDAVIDNSAEE